MTHFWVTCGGKKWRNRSGSIRKGHKMKGMLSRECILGGTRCAPRIILTLLHPLEPWRSGDRRRMVTRDQEPVWCDTTKIITTMWPKAMSPLNLKHFNCSQWTLLPFTMKLTVTLILNRIVSDSKEVWELTHFWLRVKFWVKIA